MTAKKTEPDEKTEYLWAAHAALGRGLDNLRVAHQAIEAAEHELSRVAGLYEFPEGCEPDELVGKVSILKMALEESLSDGMSKSASFHQTLVTQERP